MKERRPKASSRRHNGNQRQSPRTCWSCRKPVSSIATRCKCGVYLDWRRLFLRGWRTALVLAAFLAAVVTIWSLCFPLLKPDVSAEFAFDGQNDDGVDIRITNTGKKPITVNSGQLTVTGKDGKAIGELTTDKKFFHARSILIGPNSSQLVTYYLTGYEGWVFATPSDTCTLQFKYTGDSVKYGDAIQTIDCGDVQDLSLMWGAWANSAKRSSDYKYP